MAHPVIFRSQKQWVLDELQPESLLHVYCDASVQKVEEYLPADQIAEDARGGGGTSFRPVFELVDTWDEPPKLLVYLTDLAGCYPEQEPQDYPVLWATWSKRWTPPWGELVRADLKDLIHFPRRLNHPQPIAALHRTKHPPRFWTFTGPRDKRGERVRTSWLQKQGGKSVSMVNDG